MSNKPIIQRRIRRSPEQWQALLDQYESSGLSQQVFCRRSGLPYSTFARWRRRLLFDRPPVETPGVGGPELFVELANQAVELPSTPSGWDVELQLSEQVFLRLRRPPC